MKKPNYFATIFFLVLLSFISCTKEQEKSPYSRIMEQDAKRLSSEEVKKMFTGKKVVFGDRGYGEYHADGKFFSKHKGADYKGTWWVNDVGIICHDIQPKISNVKCRYAVLKTKDGKIWGFDLDDRVIGENYTFSNL